MAGDTNNPRIWNDADVSVAPVGTPGPTDIATALDAAFDSLGLLSEDGMTSTREREETDHYAYGGILVRTTRTKHKEQFTVTCLESTPAVFDLVNPGSSAVEAAGVTTRTVQVPNTPNPKSVVLELLDGGITRRRHIPSCEVTDIGEVQLTDNEMEAYELTFTIYPDANGVTYYDISDDPSWDPTGS